MLDAHTAVCCQYIHNSSAAIAAHRPHQAQPYHLAIG